MTTNDLSLLNVSTDGDNWTVPHTFDEMAVLQTLNEKKAVLLVPAIVYTVVLMIVGVIGNPIAIFIYGYRWPHTTTRQFLLCLAIFDLINCVITMPTEIALMVNFYYFNNSVICKISRFTTYMMNNASVFVLLVISIDRFIRICKPHNQPISVQGSKMACCLAVVVGIGVSWPALVMYGREYVPMPIPGGPVIKGVMCLVENEYTSTSYPLAFIIYLWVAFCVIAIVMTVLYIFIGREIIKRKRMKDERTASTSSRVRKIRKEKESLMSYDSVPTTIPPTTLASPVADHQTSPNDGNASSHLTSPCNEDSAASSGLIKTCMRFSKSRLRPGKSTLMLFAITMVYIFSFLPFLIVGIIRLLTGDSFYPTLTPTEEVAVNIFLRSYLVNNCANPIVYGLCNSQFRKECNYILKCRKRTSRT